MGRAVTTTPVPVDHPHWIRFYVDGGTFVRDRAVYGVYWSVCCEDPAQEKPVMIRKQDMTHTTNNDAEWLALLDALRYAVEHYETAAASPLPIVIYSDSQLIVKQFSGEYRSKVARHHRFRDECRALAARLTFVVVEWRPREVMVEKLGH